MTKRPTAGRLLFIVTRPRAQADDWAARLQALGLRARVLPLLNIAPPDDTAPVLAAWRDIATRTLVHFVSANAVREFFACAPAAAWPECVRAASTGPGTSAALRRQGVPDAAIDEPAADAATFDSEALWARLASRDWAGRRVLVVRGEEGRDWLAQTLGERGAQVDFVAAYRRRPPLPTAPEKALLVRAQAAPAVHVWLFSSSQAVAHLRDLAPAADWAAGSALASHPRIAEAAREVGFGRVEAVAPKPQAVADWAARQALNAGPPIQSALQ